MTSTTEIEQEYKQISGIMENDLEFVDLIDALQDRGFTDKDISVLMNEKTHQQFFAPKQTTKSPEGTAIGGFAGGLIGAIVGGLTLMGSVVSTSGIGLLIAGPLVGALTGSAIGMASGGLVGGLIGLGIPEHEAVFYEKALNEDGHILIVVHTPSEQEKEIKALFERMNASKIKVNHLS